MKEKQERWLAVRGFEGLYEVSDLGRVRSLDRVVANGSRWPGRLCSLTPHGAGYRIVGLSKDGKSHAILVHRIVLEAFVGPCPPGMQGAHGNGIRDDNRLTNLRWDTISGNHADKFRHGTMPMGSRHYRAKLTEAQAREIIKRRKGGETLARIAKAFGVTPSNVLYIAKGKSWKAALQ